MTVRDATRAPLLEAPSLDPALLAGGGMEIVAAEGCWLTDRQGRRYFDASAGSGAVNLGHGYAPVVQACVEQLQRLVHVGWNIANEPRARLRQALAALLPFDDAAILLTVTGAEAVEAAIKLALADSGRDWLVAFENSYHGKTAGALSVTWAKRFRQFGVCAPGAVAFTPFAGGDADEAACLQALRQVLRSRAQPPAALIVEPVQGAEGIFPAQDTFLAAVIDAAHEVGTLVIFDEIYTGFGRCGRPFIASAPGLAPDLLVLGKGLGNGMPISAVVGPAARLAALPSGGHSSTFAGHPVSCAAGVAVVHAMNELAPWDQAMLHGQRLRAAIAELGQQIGRVGPVRGRGLMLAFDFIDRHGLADADSARQFLNEAMQRGLVARGGGKHGATIKLTPPLLMSATDLDFLLSVVRDSAIAIVD